MPFLAHNIDNPNQDFQAVSVTCIARMYNPVGDITTWPWPGVGL